jgi:hypothetical protein
MEQKVAIALFAVTSIAIIVIIVLVARKKHKEPFKKCICSSDQGGRERECQDTVEVNNLYVTNKLTEFSNLPNHGWTKVSPGDPDFPISQGCSWPDNSTKGWKSWDFTDFGS